MKKSLRILFLGILLFASPLVSNYIPFSPLPTVSAMTNSLRIQMVLAMFIGMKQSQTFSLPIKPLFWDAMTMLRTIPS